MYNSSSYNISLFPVSKFTSSDFLLNCSESLVHIYSIYIYNMIISHAYCKNMSKSEPHYQSNVVGRTAMRSCLSKCVFNNIFIFMAEE
jgi:hypothetical protein